MCYNISSSYVFRVTGKGKYKMPEINEELNITVTVNDIHFLTGNKGVDRLMFEPITISKEQAATLAWLSNHNEGTQLELHLKKA